MSSKRIAVIGAGASGITAIKSCVDEGLTPVCFERNGHVGGLWYYTDEVVEGQACIMKSTVINTSKEMMCYSDFPIPAENPVFMHNTQVYEYFKQYVSNFDLEKYIHFHTDVLYIHKAENFSRFGQWEIKTRDRKSGEEKVEIFDGVFACSGHHADKHEPTFPGLSNFQGKVLHSHDYRKPDSFEDKRILIIGIGNSGGDMAVELSRKAKQVIVSTRRGTWILNRVAEKGYPMDMLFLTRFFKIFFDNFPSLVNKYQEFRLSQRIDHDLYSLRPEYGPGAQHPMVNDDIPNRIISGSVKIKADVKQFTPTGVEFVDGTKEDDIDVVVLATGYSFGFPYIDKEVIDVQENRIQLYKYVFPPDLERQTLAVIGCFQPLGAINPICEMQCRLATKVFKGDVFLPSRATMWKDIRKKEAAMAKRYAKTRRHTIQVDYIPFMDELAEMVGCKPDPSSLLLKDPTLALKVVLGPVTPYQYRLQGPGQWAGARQAIMTQWDRIRQPLNTRPLPVTPKGLFGGLSSHFVLFAVFLILYFVIRYIFM